MNTVRREYVLLSAVIFGSLLRAYQLPGQILFGDEWHAIHTAISSDYIKILSSFGAADHSIPITLYYKLIIDTVGLSEWTVRAPFLLAGALTILFPPLLVRIRVSRFTSDIFAWLIALSPTLIFYSRLARPYMVALLCSFSAVILFYSWWTTGNRLHAFAYVILTTMCGYLLLVVLPFALGPFVFFFVLSLLGRSKGGWHSIRRLASLAVLTIFPLIIFLGLPLYADFPNLANKAGHSIISFLAVFDAFRMLTGMKWPILIILIGIITASGVVHMCREASLFPVYLITLSLIQLVAIVVIRPIGSGAPHILARYILTALPALLLFTAAGVETLQKVIKTGSNRWPRIALGAVICTAFLVGGPILDVSYRPNNATSLILLIQTLYGSNHQSIIKRVPGFYRTLASYSPSTLTIVEAPYHWPGDHIPLYQKVHRQTVLMGLTDGLCGQGFDTHAPKSGHGISLKTIVDLNDASMLSKRDVDFVIFHKRLQDEARVPLPGYRGRDISGCISTYRNWFGPPVFEDRDIVVFAVLEERETLSRKNQVSCGSPKDQRATF